MNERESLERIAKYPMCRSEEMSIETAREIARAALASQAQQEPAKAKHHPICDRRYPSLCDACNAEAKEESQAQQPCDMNELCLDCQPRGKNGECPDQLPPAPEGGE